MSFLGRWEIDDLLTFPANTHTAATGAATDADAVPAYRVYEDETGTPILTGTMALLDSTNTAGFYSEQITLSAANGFEVGKCYTIYISATVASVVGTMSYTFQVEAALATASALDTVDNFLDTEIADIQARLPAALVSGRIDASVGAMAANVVTDAAVASDVTIASVTGAVGSVTGAVGSVTGNVGGNVVGSVASVTAGVTVTTNNDKTGYGLSAAAVQAIWDALTSALTTVGSIGKLLVDNINATISSRATQVSVDDLPTNAELATSQAAADDATLAAIAALNNLSAAQVNTEVDTALADYDAPTFAELDARTDAIDAALVIIDDFLDTEVAAIKAKTDSLPADPADASDIATATTAIAGYIDTEVASILAAVDTEVAAIKVVTDALTSAGATKLALSAGTIVVGAAAAGTLSTTQMTTNLTEATDDHYNGRIIIWTSGVLINQATDITDYTGATKLLTYTAVTEAPTAADSFIIV